MKYLSNISENSATPVLRIPKNTQVSETLFYQDATHQALTIVLEPNSSANIIDETVAGEKSVRSIHVQKGAKLHYTHIQRCGEDVIFIEEQVAEVDQDAVFQTVHIGLGSRQMTSNIHTKLMQPGAQAKILGVFFGHKHQVFEAHTIQDHEAPNTHSDLLFKSALKDESQSHYEGVIRIPRQAQKSDAFQTNRNLLLSEKAKAKSIPKLEIIADDVRCKHAAAMGTLNAEELFYLQSRGLDGAQAERMVVEGFFEEVLSQIPSDEVRQRLVQNVHERLLEGKLG